MTRTLVMSLAACLLMPQVARADDMDKAKSAFKKAKRYFEAEEYEASLPWFEKAYDLSKHRPSTIFGLAQCLRVLKKYDRAIILFEEYVATGPEDADQVNETIKLLKDLTAEARAREEAKRKKALEEEERRKAAEKPPESPPADARLVEAPVTAADDDGGVLESPVFWIITGVVVAGGAVAAGVALSSGGADYYPGSSNVLLEP